MYTVSRDVKQAFVEARKRVAKMLQVNKLLYR
jgi:two-component sensor histidine kinase